MSWDLDIAHWNEDEESLRMDADLMPELTKDEQRSIKDHSAAVTNQTDDLLAAIGFQHTIENDPWVPYMVPKLPSHLLEAHNLFEFDANPPRSSYNERQQKSPDSDICTEDNATSNALTVSSSGGSGFSLPSSDSIESAYISIEPAYTSMSSEPSEADLGFWFDPFHDMPTLNSLPIYNLLNTTLSNRRGDGDYNQCQKHGSQSAGNLSLYSKSNITDCHSPLKQKSYACSCTTRMKSKDMFRVGLHSCSCGVSGGSQDPGVYTLARIPTPETSPGHFQESLPVRLDAYIPPQSTLPLRYLKYGPEIHQEKYHTTPIKTETTPDTKCKTTWGEKAHDILPAETISSLPVHIPEMDVPPSLMDGNTESWVRDLKLPPSFKDELNGSPSQSKASSSESPSYITGENSLDSNVTDSDLLSISDTSESPEICLESVALSPLQDQMLNRIMLDYWKPVKYKVEPSTQSSTLSYIPTNKVGPEQYHDVFYNSLRRSKLDTKEERPHKSCSPSATDAGNVYTDTSGSFSSGPSVPRGGTKRRLSEQDCVDGIDDGVSAKFSKKLKQENIRQQALACPYWKRDPEKYRTCCKLMHKRIRDVKQHLHRRHTPEFYCPRCFQIFADSQRYEVHNTSLTPCSRLPDSQLEGITNQQSRAISRKSNRTYTEEMQWFVIWDVLFPGVDRPHSAYVDAELSEELNSFHEYWENRGIDILMDELISRGMWSLSAEERDVQGRQILAGGLDLIYQQWLVHRIPTPTTQSQTPSLLTPPMTNVTNSTRSSYSQAQDAPVTSSTASHETQINTRQPNQTEASVPLRGPRGHTMFPAVGNTQQTPIETLQEQDVEPPPPQPPPLSEGMTAHAVSDGPETIDFSTDQQLPEAYDFSDTGHIFSSFFNDTNGTYTDLFIQDSDSGSGHLA